jgi:hypothetical protein
VFENRISSACFLKKGCCFVGNGISRFCVDTVVNQMNCVPLGWKWTSEMSDRISICYVTANYTVVPPYPWVIRYKTYRSNGKPQIILNAICNVMFM